MKLIDSFQRAQLMGTTFTRNVKYGAFYTPVSDKGIIQRLRHRLEDYCAVRSKTPPLLIKRMRLPPPERHGFCSPTLNPRNRTTARARAEFKKSRNIMRMLRDGGDACGTDAPWKPIRRTCAAIVIMILRWMSLHGRPCPASSRARSPREVGNGPSEKRRGRSAFPAGKLDSE